MLARECVQGDDKSFSLCFIILRADRCCEVPLECFAGKQGGVQLTSNHPAPTHVESSPLPIEVMRAEPREKRHAHAFCNLHG